MGRQFQLYLLPSDAIALVDRLREKFDAKVFANYRYEHEQFETTSPIRENPARGSKPASTSVSCYLAPPFSKIERNYYPKPNWWVIDSDSEGVEFTGCEFDGSTLIRGRLYYQTNVVRDLQYVSKSSQFIKWAEAVYRDTKRFLHYEKRIDAYVGKGALAFRETGGQFASLTRADGSFSPA